MYFLDLTVLSKQLLPPHWRSVEKVAFFTAILTPFAWVLNSFKMVRKETKNKLNLSSQVMVIEQHVRNITNLPYGIEVIDSTRPGTFLVRIPVAGMTHEENVKIFLNKTIPSGRNYRLVFYREPNNQ